MVVVVVAGAAVVVGVAVVVGAAAVVVGAAVVAGVAAGAVSSLPELPHPAATSATNTTDKTNRVLISGLVSPLTQLGGTRSGEGSATLDSNSIRHPSKN